MIKTQRFDYYSPKRVSFIVATKNKSHYLEKTLKQFEKIKKSTDELIIIDGLSKDSTSIVLKKYRKTIDLLVSEKDLGPAHALNKGILLSQGKYIKQITDDDDFDWKEMEKAIYLMEKHKEIDLLVCGGIRESKGMSWPFYVPRGVDYGRNCENVFKYGGCGVGFIVRRSSLAITGFFPVDHIVGDPAFLLQAIRNDANVKFCRLKLFNHKIFQHSFIVKRDKEVIEDTYNLIRSYCSLYFYIKYRYRVIINKIINFIYPLKVFIKMVKKTEKYDIIWDGGFS